MGRRGETASFPVATKPVVRLLGPVTAVGATGQPLPLGPPRRHAVLAALLVRPGATPTVGS